MHGFALLRMFGLVVRMWMMVGALIMLALPDSVLRLSGREILDACLGVFISSLDPVVVLCMVSALSGILFLCRRGAHCRDDNSEKMAHESQKIVHFSADVPAPGERSM